ncbi:PFDN5 [Cordylochernes scorpioides]|uniref:PFDN5 n=1 Tax=Cordylochernes scorpioides TaxID=51811 RepID=A0ABY6KH66_9ARAC|nr:PFDN5 [Cordylochernes scorpioides]
MSEGQKVEITKLDLATLTQLKQRLDQEVDFFRTSIQQLKMAQMKFLESEENVQKLTPEDEGKDILVPLTYQMYVPGKLVDINKLMVDVGTGYYIEKDLPGCQDYFKRKVAFISKNLESLQQVAQEKISQREAVMQVMQVKVQATLAQQMASTSQ